MSTEVQQTQEEVHHAEEIITGNRERIEKVEKSLNQAMNKLNEHTEMSDKMTTVEAECSSVKEVLQVRTSISTSQNDFKGLLGKQLKKKVEQT